MPHYIVYQIDSNIQTIHLLVADKENFILLLSLEKPKKNKAINTTDNQFSIEPLLPVKY